MLLKMGVQLRHTEAKLESANEDKLGNLSPQRPPLTLRRKVAGGGGWDRVEREERDVKSSREQGRTMLIVGLGDGDRGRFISMIGVEEGWGNHFKKGWGRGEIREERDAKLSHEQARTILIVGRGEGGSLLV